MNAGFVHKIPMLPLVLLWLAYALLGWYLAVHHIAWLVGAFIAAVAIAVVRRSNAWLEELTAFGSKILIVILTLGASVALVATWSVLFSLFLIPIATTLLADLEMRFAGFDKKESFRVLTFLAGTGLFIGEAVDLLFFPSSRF
ncbi:hypothetical protein BCD64_27655 [Nostoc sp. MBR 210]|uniref:Uncharacterized protein n=1 Tax=Nostoc spongiaeforme FACHB-130 TaxID=1357510 RepID=A0ABR8G0J9_9NOSO|nr:hypothetical protein [Nostoc spongiaeforme]MBD2596747.1 hypothetical protein [Nostoc spongiaeforme FACHB-130]OCQ90451.1 hypothetical protein BCD64_27655 [Nostoc sp. MBR 210]